MLLREFLGKRSLEMEKENNMVRYFVMNNCKAKEFGV
jgi:hypothetical protein